MVGRLLTSGAAWAAHRADEATEEGLLETQTLQAAAVLSTAIFVIQQPLTTTLQVQATAGPDGDLSVFRRTFTVNVGKGKLFVSASLWRREGGTITRLAAVGASPGMDPDGAGVQDLLRRALESKTSVVEPITAANQDRIAYALADPSTSSPRSSDSARGAPARSSWPTPAIRSPCSSTLIAFTDGLVERREADIDTGMQRLADAADRFGHESPSDLLTSILARLRTP